MKLRRGRALCCLLLLLQLCVQPLMPSAVHAEEAARSRGCVQRSGAANNSVHRLTATDGVGHNRSFLVQAPDDSGSVSPHRVVFVFHAMNGSAEELSEGLRDIGDAARTTVFVAPQGIEFGSFGIGWDDSATGYDLPFFDRMLSIVSEDYCVDSSRIFAVGFSWGGDFVVTLACMRGSVVRAVVANSTDDEFANHSDYRTYHNYPCPSGPHPAVYFQHAVDGDDAYPPPDFATTSKLFQHLNSCPSRGGSVVEPHSPIMACVKYTGCAIATTECFFDHSIGHRRPPNWASDAWIFLSSF